MSSAKTAKWRPPFDILVIERGDMVETEVGSATVDNATTIAFGEMEDEWGNAGSPWRSFYEKAAAMPNRLIAWNTKRYIAAFLNYCS
jgi:hypothetical protein